MGKAWPESAMRRLPGSHGLSPESHTQRRNAGVGRKFHPGVSFAQDHQQDLPEDTGLRLVWPERQPTLGHDELGGLAWPVSSGRSCW